jgi:hypothetical protein
VISTQSAPTRQKKRSDNTRGSNISRISRFTSRQMPVWQMRIIIGLHLSQQKKAANKSRYYTTDNVQIFEKKKSNIEMTKVRVKKRF